MAADDLNYLADCHRPRVHRAACQQEDAEEHRNAAEASTRHRVEVPPGISSMEKRNVGKDMHRLDS